MAGRVARRMDNPSRAWAPSMREKLQRRIPYHGGDDIYGQRTNVPCPIRVEKTIYLLGKNGFPNFPFIFAINGVWGTRAFRGMQLEGFDWCARHPNRCAREPNYLAPLQCTVPEIRLHLICVARPGAPLHASQPILRPALFARPLSPSPTSFLPSSGKRGGSLCETCHDAPPNGASAWITNDLQGATVVTRLRNYQTQRSFGSACLWGRPNVRHGSTP
jgi:hypothetical protein